MTSKALFGDLECFVPTLIPFHLLAYSTLLGTELYQSFVVTKVCYNALPRSAFTTLQRQIFSIYFQGQVPLLFFTIVTFPPYSLASLLLSKWDLVPFAIAGVMTGLNFAIYGPKTSKAMVERIHQETRDSVLSGNSSTSEISEDMQLLNRKFSKNHAMSIHLNLITIGATLWYGWRLASRFHVN